VTGKVACEAPDDLEATQEWQWTCHVNAS